MMYSAMQEMRYTRPIARKPLKKAFMSGMTPKYAPISKGTQRNIARQMKQQVLPMAWVPLLYFSKYAFLSSSVMLSAPYIHRLKRTAEAIAIIIEPATEKLSTQSALALSFMNMKAAIASPPTTATARGSQFDSEKICPT